MTDADHGPASGWNPGYGAGQAVFGTWMISRSYYYIDGQNGGGPGNWQGGTQNFGFRAYSTDEVVYFAVLLIGKKICLVTYALNTSIWKAAAPLAEE